MNNEVDALLESAYQHCSAGFYPAALREYQNVIRLDPENVAAHYNLHVLYKQTNELQLAIRELEEAARLSPDDGDIYLAMGVLYKEMGREKNAQELLEMVNELPGNSMIRHITLARLANEQKDYIQALTHCQNALKQQPDSSYVYGLMGHVLLQMGRTVEAQKALLDATRDETAESYNLYNLALAEKRLHHYAAAARALERALEKDGNYYKALTFLAATEFRLGRWRSAWRHLQQAVKCYPSKRR